MGLLPIFWFLVSVMKIWNLLPLTKINQLKAKWILAFLKNNSEIPNFSFSYINSNSGSHHFIGITIISTCQFLKKCTQFLNIVFTFYQMKNNMSDYFKHLIIYQHCFLLCFYPHLFWIHLLVSFSSLGCIWVIYILLDLSLYDL